MNKGRILDDVLNENVKGKHPRGSPRLRQEEQIRKYVTHRRKEEHGKKLRRSRGKTEIDG
jgi:hypothetical protein